jgi:hypothetical protein
LSSYWAAPPQACGMRLSKKKSTNIFGNNTGLKPDYKNRQMKKRLMEG